MWTRKFSICIFDRDGCTRGGTVYPIRKSDSGPPWHTWKNASSALRANHLSTGLLFGYKCCRGTGQAVCICPNGPSILSIAKPTGWHGAIINSSVAWRGGSNRLRIGLGTRSGWEQGKRLELLLSVVMGEKR